MNKGNDNQTETVENSKNIKFDKSWEERSKETKEPKNGCDRLNEPHLGNSSSSSRGRASAAVDGDKTTYSSLGKIFNKQLELLSESLELKSNKTSVNVKSKGNQEKVKKENRIRSKADGDKLRRQKRAEKKGGKAEFESFDKRSSNDRRNHKANSSSSNNNDRSSTRSGTSRETNLFNFGFEQPNKNLTKTLKKATKQRVTSKEVVNCNNFIHSDDFDGFVTNDESDWLDEDYYDDTRDFFSRYIDRGESWFSDDDDDEDNDDGEGCNNNPGFNENYFHVKVVEHVIGQLVTSVGIRDWPAFFCLQGEFGIEIKNHQFALLACSASESINSKLPSQLSSSAFAKKKPNQLSVNKTNNQQQMHHRHCKLHPKVKNQQKNTVDNFIQLFQKRGDPIVTETYENAESEISTMIIQKSNKDKLKNKMLSNNNSDDFNKSIHLRNKAIQFISLYQLNRRKEAVQIQNFLLDVPTEAIADSLSPPLTESLAKTMAVFDLDGNGFLEGLDFLQDGGNNDSSSAEWENFISDYDAGLSDVDYYDYDDML